MVIISVIVAITLFTSGHWSYSNISHHGGLFPNGLEESLLHLQSFL